MAIHIRARLVAAVALSASIAVLAGCAPSSGSDDTEKSTLSLVGFAVPKAGNNAAQAAFAKTDAGKGTRWKESYGASGDQSRAVAEGLEADYVHFSLTPDVTRLVDEGIVAKDWDAGRNKGIVTDSVVVLVVREGNPKDVEGWDDLARKDVGIVTPNPGSSGSALEHPRRVAARLGGRMVRPHDIDISKSESPEHPRGIITRWTRVGFEIRLEVTLDGEVETEPVQVIVTRAEADALGLQVDDKVWLRAVVPA